MGYSVNKNRKDAAKNETDKIIPEHFSLLDNRYSVLAGLFAFIFLIIFYLLLKSDKRSILDFETIVKNIKSVVKEINRIFLDLNGSMVAICISLLAISVTAVSIAGLKKQGDETVRRRGLTFELAGFLIRTAVILLILDLLISSVSVFYNAFILVNSEKILHTVLSVFIISLLIFCAFRISTFTKGVSISDEELALNTSQAVCEQLEYYEQRKMKLLSLVECYAKNDVQAIFSRKYKFLSFIFSVLSSICLSLFITLIFLASLFIFKANINNYDMLELFNEIFLTTLLLLSMQMLFNSFLYFLLKIGGNVIYSRFDKFGIWIFGLLFLAPFAIVVPFSVVVGGLNLPTQNSLILFIIILYTLLFIASSIIPIFFPTKYSWRMLSIVFSLQIINSNIAKLKSSDTPRLQ